MTTADPALFDPESTGSFTVGTLAERFPVNPPKAPAGGPCLFYTHTDGSTRTLIDQEAPSAVYAGDTDRGARELLVARALLVHALHLTDRELSR